VTAPATYIPDILEEHVEELAFLWGQRRGAVRSPRYTVRAFFHLEERLAAHLQGVLAVGGEALPLLEDTLREGDPLSTFAAAYALLHHADATATGRVLDAFARAKGGGLAALRDALCHGPAGSLLPQLQAMIHGTPLERAVAAAEIFAFHSKVPINEQRVLRFLNDEDAAVRTGGWRLAGYLGMRLDPKSYAAGLRDDAVVRRAALHAAAWAGEPAILTVTRKLADAPSLEHFDALELLAILGAPDDLARFATIGRSDALGPARFRLLGSYGNPALIDLLLDGMRIPDPAAAVAAGAAFTKMTGADVTSTTVVRTAAEAPADEFEAEFQDEVALPDPELARRHWEKARARLERAARLCRGVDVAGPITPEEFALLDMESRWEASLRARFNGVWSGSPLRLERFPQPRR